MGIFVGEIVGGEIGKFLGEGKVRAHVVVDEVGEQLSGSSGCVVSGKRPLTAIRIIDVTAIGVPQHINKYLTIVELIKRGY